MKMTYTLTGNLSPNDYVHLLYYLFDTCETCSVVVRHSVTVSPTTYAFLEDAKPYLVDSNEQSEWPGTRLSNSTAQVNCYRLEPGLKELMAYYASNFYEWVQPQLPEDPSFYRSDKTVLLVTTSHEQDIYLELDSTELSHLHSRVPNIELEHSQ